MSPDFQTLWAAPGSHAPAPLLIRDLLVGAATALGAAGSPTPRLDADVLLANVLALSRAQLYTRLRDPWPAAALDAFSALLRRRLAGEPVAYIIGHKDFYGLDLLVDARVLIPRPETEELVGAALAAVPADSPGPVADIGTGSGAIALALARHRPQLRVYGCDLSPDALAVARLNASRLGLPDRVQWLGGDLGAPLPERVLGLVANLPYTVLEEVEPAVRAWEPTLALAGGGDQGSAVIARLLAQAPDLLLPGGFVALEIGWDQAALLLPHAAAAFPHAELRVQRDLADRDRILWVQT
ncbi:MAG: peptide chain release factor N(5)-glutamine methyltransferase [Chloroflexota bacterium]|nr:peptide chain release factor N(5)-glutamine methyltransferase [Chloroflexota bacterium]